MVSLNNQFPNFKVFVSQMHEIIESTAIFNQENHFPHKLFQIPIVNLTCDLADFQHLWRQIYHIIMNTNGNAIDLIVDGDHKIIFASLLRTTEEGNFLGAESLQVGDLPISDIQQLSLVELFEKFSPWIKKQHNIEIGNVRVYSNEFIKEIDTLIGDGMMHSDNFIDQVFSLSTLLFQACGSPPESNLLFDCFPSTAFSQFLSSFTHIFNGKSSSIFRDHIVGFIKRCIPPVKSTISFQVNGDYFSYLVDNRKAIFHPKYLPKFDSNYDHGENPIIQRKQYLREVAHKQKTSWNRFVDHSQVIRLLEAVFHSPFPLNLSRIELLLQMYLEYYRAYQFQWDMYPAPAIFNEQLRYIFNAMRIPLNLRKIAYWKAPRFILKNCLQNVGINGNILVVFGSNFEELLKKSSASLGQSLFALKIQLSKGDIKKIDLLSGDYLKNSKNADSIEEFFQDLRVNMSSSTDFIDSLYWISSDMVRAWWRVFNYEIFSSKLGGWKKLKSMVSMMKSPKNFGVSPKTTLYSHMIRTKSGKFIKELLPLLIELREF